MRAIVVGILICLFLSRMGEWDARADSINVFAPYWLPVVAGAAAICAALALKKRHCYTMVVSLLTVFLSVWQLFDLQAYPQTTQGTPSLVTNGSSLRIVSFNLRKDNSEAASAVAWIIEQDPDIVAVFEVSGDSKDVAKNLHERLPYVYSCTKIGICSTRLYSRYPAERTETLARGDAINRQALSALTATFEIEGVDVHVTAAHLDRLWPSGDQTADLVELSDALSSRVGANRLVMGDFNAPPWTYAMIRFAKGNRLRLASQGLRTWPSPAPGIIPIISIDHIFKSGCIQVDSVALGPNLGSDHLPIVADVSLENCPTSQAPMLEGH